MNRRYLTLLLVVVTCLTVVAPFLVAGSAVAQTGNNTTATATTPTPTPTSAGDTAPGTYSIEELRRGGVGRNADIESVRALGDPPKGFVAARYRSPNLMDQIFGGKGSWEYVTPSAVVHQNEIQMYGSALGDVSGDYRLTVVYWHPDRRSTANGTEIYAANQTVRYHQVTFGENELYSYTNVSLEHREDRKWEVTAWLTKPGQGGEVVEGARWRFQHQSNPASAGTVAQSQGDVWGWGLRNVAIPAVIGVVIALVLAKLTLAQTGTGPRYGVGAWLLLVGLITLVLSGVIYYQFSVIIDNVPQIMGATVGVIAYGAGLTFHDPTKTIAFMRRELGDAQVVKGGPPIEVESETASDGGQEPFDYGDFGATTFDEFTEALSLDLPEVPAVRTQDGYRVPIRGIRPFFARLFADAATLDLSKIATRQHVDEGRIDDIIMVDPDSEVALKHKRARLVNVLPWYHLPDDASVSRQAWALVVSLGIALGPMIAGYMAFDAVTPIPWIGVVIGAAVTSVLMYSAEDGWIEFTPAPPMYKRAEDSLTLLQQAYSLAAEEESHREGKYKERAKTAAEGREDAEFERKTVTDRVMEELGIGSAVTSEPELSDTDPGGGTAEADEDDSPFRELFETVEDEETSVTDDRDDTGD